MELEFWLSPGKGLHGIVLAFFVLRPVGRGFEYRQANMPSQSHCYNQGDPDEA